MKNKLFLLALGFGIAFSGMAQNSKRKSAVNHNKQSAKHEVKHQKHDEMKHANGNAKYKTTDVQRAELKAINARHKAAIAAIRANASLTNQQQKDQIKLANERHQREMKAYHITIKG